MDILLPHEGGSVALSITLSGTFSHNRSPDIDGLELLDSTLPRDVSIKGLWSGWEIDR